MSNDDFNCWVGKQVYDNDTGMVGWLTNGVNWGSVFISSDDQLLISNDLNSIMNNCKILGKAGTCQSDECWVQICEIVIKKWCGWMNNRCKYLWFLHQASKRHSSHYVRPRKVTHAVYAHDRNNIRQMCAPSYNVHANKYELTKSNNWTGSLAINNENDRSSWFEARAESRELQQQWLSFNKISMKFIAYFQ